MVIEDSVKPDARSDFLTLQPIPPLLDRNPGLYRRCGDDVGLAQARVLDIQAALAGLHGGAAPWQGGGDGFGIDPFRVLDADGDANFHRLRWDVEAAEQQQG